MLNGTVVATGERVAVAVDVTEEMVDRAQVSMATADGYYWAALSERRRLYYRDGARVVLMAGLGLLDPTDEVASVAAFQGSEVRQ